MTTEDWVLDPASVMVLWQSFLALIASGGAVEAPSEAISAAGPLAPVAVVAGIALATVFAPIPGGPIAVAAGAGFGALKGGLLTLAGAQAGAMLAFLIARRFGARVVRCSSIAAVAWVGRPRPQGRLALMVFLSRLVPFISFDAVSYAAGLTTLGFWRFALATFAGIAPMSFLLAATGAGIAGPAGLSASVMALLIGVTAVPLVIGAAIRLWRRRWSSGAER